MIPLPNEELLLGRILLLSLGQYTANFSIVVNGRRQPIAT
jgi:hypothetical protein